MTLSDPLLQLGSFSVYPFGIALAVVFILGVFLFWREARREGFASDAVFDLIFLSSFTALIIGRLSFVLLTGGEFSLSAISRVGEGVFWAPAFLAGLGAFYLYVRRREGWSFPKLADLAALVLALGQGLIFIVAELTGYLPSIAVFGAGYLGLSAVLAFLKKRSPASGAVFSIYLIGFGLLNILAEPQRSGPAIASHIRLNYVFAVILAVLGILMAFRSFAGLRALWAALRQRVVVPQVFKRVEKQLQFKLKVKRRAIRLRFGKDGEENEPENPSLG
jgi:prolipoprotein diacylglyceryltransferase